MIELKEYWNVEAEIVPYKHGIYDKKLRIVIKNHSPHKRMFKIKLVRHEFKDPQNTLHFIMYSGLNSPLYVEVDKYRKKIVEIDIPRLINPDHPKLYFYIENQSTKEVKVLIVKL